MNATEIRRECAIRGIPEKIVNWRIAKGFRRQSVWKRPDHILQYGGEYWTPTMLEEHCGVTSATLIKRWNAGLRDADLIAPAKHTNAPVNGPQTGNQDLIRDRAIRDCAAHLEALRAAHPDHCEPPAFDTAFRENFARKFTNALEARARQVFQHAYV